MSFAVPPQRRRPTRSELPAPAVQDFRKALDHALSAVDPTGRAWGNARWGAYAFYDYDGEPIYVGQTNEQLRVRVRRHLTNQRTDAVAMRILDVMEVAQVELWPLWDLEGASKKDKLARDRLDAIEYSAYCQAIERSKFRAILNEKIPPVRDRVPLPPSGRFVLINSKLRAERGHPDTRIARRAETIARLTAVAHERGEVSAGLRRVIVIQAVRLAYLAASRLAVVEGRSEPDATAIDVTALVGGSLLVEPTDPYGTTDTDPMLDDEVPFDS